MRRSASGPQAIWLSSRAWRSASSSRISACRSRAKGRSSGTVVLKSSPRVPSSASPEISALQARHPAAPADLGDHHGDQRHHGGDGREQVDDVFLGVLAAPLHEAHVVHDHQVAERLALGAHRVHRHVQRAVRVLHQAAALGGGAAPGSPPPRERWRWRRPACPPGRTGRPRRCARPGRCGRSSAAPSAARAARAPARRAAPAPRWRWCVARISRSRTNHCSVSRSTSGTTA